MLNKYLFLSELMFMVQKPIGINMGCSHGLSMACGALYQCVIDSPFSGMGPWGDGQRVRAGRLPMHLNTVRRDVDIQERI